MIVTVKEKVEVEIPEGFELADEWMRPVHTGEWYLDIFSMLHKWTLPAPSSGSYAILRKVWEPEVGKVYLFSDYEDRVGSLNGDLLEYDGRTDAGSYLADDFTWKFCWPVPIHRLGE